MSRYYYAKGATLSYLSVFAVVWSAEIVCIFLLAMMRGVFF